MLRQEFSYCRAHFREQFKLEWNESLSGADIGDIVRREQDVLTEEPPTTCKDMQRMGIIVITGGTRNCDV